MVKNKDYYNFLEESLNRHDSGDSWGKIANEFYKKFGENISKSAMRHRCLDYNERKNKQCNKIKYTNNSCNGEFVQYNCDGSVEESTGWTGTGDTATVVITLESLYPTLHTDSLTISHAHLPLYALSIISTILRGSILPEIPVGVTGFCCKNHLHNSVFILLSPFNV